MFRTAYKLDTFGCPLEDDRKWALTLALVGLGFLNENNKGLRREWRESEWMQMGIVVVNCLGDNSNRECPHMHTQHTI